MTEQELIELAAKAAGMSGQFLEDGGFWLNGERTPDNSTDWNPLLRDGDALRLAIALRLTLHLELPRIGIGPRMDFPEVWVEDDQDEAQEVRRAIVMAAAEIGKAL